MCKKIFLLISILLTVSSTCAMSDSHAMAAYFKQQFSWRCSQPNLHLFCFGMQQLFTLVRNFDPSAYCINTVIQYSEQQAEAQQRLLFLTRSKLININCLASENIKLLDIYAAHAIHEGNFNSLILLLNAGADPYHTDWEDEPSSVDLVQALGFNAEKRVIQNAQHVLNLFRRSPKE